MLRRVADIGPPPWAQVAGQPSFKYMPPLRALDLACPFVRGMVEAMSATLPPPTEGHRILVDVRWWESLSPGDVPGVAGWHYDCFNQADDPRSEGEEHRLYFSGAGCRTEFDCGQLSEGVVWGYGHHDRHRISPATIAGPRLLIRVSRTRVPAVGYVAPPPVFRGASP